MDRQAFLSDRKTIDAIVRNLEIIGEAASRLTPDAKRLSREIEWAAIVGLRNRIVHEYFGVDAEIVWTIVSQDAPRLGSEIGCILETLPRE
jgi:uncharacterized protein with HEPN domain